MGWFDRFRRSVKDEVEAVERKLDADLSRKERDLVASPEEKIDSILSEIDGSDDAFDAVRGKLTRREVRADLDAQGDAETP